MVSTTDTNAETLCDIIFLIEGTAVNGAYMNEMKTNYVLPILEHFSKGVLESETYTSDKMSKFGAVVFKTSQAMPNVCCSTFGPFNTSQKLHSVIEGLELSDGKSESNANLAEGLATALMCFEELDEKRDRNEQYKQQQIAMMQQQLQQNQLQQQRAGMVNPQGTAPNPQYQQRQNMAMQNQLGIRQQQPQVFDDQNFDFM